MTTNQIAYVSYLETQRSNLAKEAETNRSNVAREQEDRRSHLANEAEVLRANQARENENLRHNQATENINLFSAQETARANRESEAIRRRANEVATYNASANLSNAETNRRNVGYTYELGITRNQIQQQQANADAYLKSSQVLSEQSRRDLMRAQANKARSEDVNTQVKTQRERVQLKVDKKTAVPKIVSSYTGILTDVAKTATSALKLFGN